MPIRKKFRAVLLFSAVVFLLPAVFLPAESVTIINSTGMDLELIQIAPEGSEIWGDDLIPYRILSDGGTVVLDLPGTAPFAMRLLDTAGVVYVLYDVESGRTGKISVGPEHRAELSHLAGSQRRIGITNSTGNTITSLRISPVEDGVWGEDLLEGRFIRDGERADILLKTMPGILNFDIRFTLASGNREIPYVKSAVILTDLASLVLSSRQDGNP